MSANDLLEKIRTSINSKYLYENDCLEEESEKMKVQLFDQDTNSVIIKPQDSEKKNLWACFSDNTDRNIADYIIFKSVGNDLISYIVELKKSKTKSNVNKATKQILSTHPLVKMIYEKTTGENPKELKTLGIRLFGPNAIKESAKISRNSKRTIPNETKKENLAIADFIQNTKKEKFTSLDNIYKKTRNKILNL